MCKMNEIKEYLIAITICCIVGGLADIITSSFSEKYPDIEKVVSLGITLCIISVILIPVLNKPWQDIIEKELAEYEYDVDNGKTDSSEFLEIEIEMMTKEYILKKTGINPIYVGIEIEVNENNVAVKDAEVKLEKDSSYCEQNVITAGREALGIDVRIVYAE